MRISDWSSDVCSSDLLRLVVDDTRSAGREIDEEDLGDRQHARAAGGFQNGEIELAAVDEGLGEERPAEALLAGGDLAPRFRRRHYGGRIEAERGVLGIRLHDHLLARRKAAAVARPARCRQSYRVQQSTSSGLGALKSVGRGKRGSVRFE